MLKRLLKPLLLPLYSRLVPDELAVFPPIETDLAGCEALLEGCILNAGAGTRDFSHLVKGELINQDLTFPGDTRTNIHIYGSLHVIPVPSAHFDTIVCIGVLEHVENPEEVM